MRERGRLNDMGDGRADLIYQDWRLYSDGRRRGDGKVANVVPARRLQAVMSKSERERNVYVYVRARVLPAYKTRLCIGVLRECNSFQVKRGTIA